MYILNRCAQKEMLTFGSVPDAQAASDRIKSEALATLDMTKLEGGPATVSASCKALEYYGTVYNRCLVYQLRQMGVTNLDTSNCLNPEVNPQAQAQG